MNNKPLPRSAVLHAVLTDFKPQLPEVFEGQNRLGEFLIFLTQDESGLSDSQISRWLSSPTLLKDTQITAILNVAEHAEAVAAKYGLPKTIFEAKTLAEVKAIVAEHLSAGSAPQPSGEGSWLVSRENLPVDLPIACGKEQMIISDLLSSITRARRHVVITQAPFDSGISFLWYLTTVRELIPRHANAIFFLRPKIKLGRSPRDVSQDFEAAISWLAASLGLQQKADGPTIVEKLINSRASVIFLAVSGPFDGRAEGVVRAALRASKDTHDLPAAIISTTVHDELPMKLPVKALRIEDEDVNIKNPDERYPFFRSLWQNYCLIRRTYRPDEGGSRLKRARWHYEYLRQRSVYPINIRLRAFFASDLSNFSYFDPTLGFERLCNMEEQQLPPEIWMFRDDVRSWVTIWDAGVKNPPLRPLKWCSTAIYWLTQETAADLGTKYQFQPLPDEKERAIVLRRGLVLDPPTVPDVDPRNFHEAAESLPAIHSYEPDPEHNRGVFQYVASIGIKAIVQDHWLITDPAARSYAHFRIAKRLYDRRHRKEALSEEFPITPHWGRSGIFFLAECIRHLMRSIAPVEKADPSRRPPKKDDNFVSAPSRSMLGCDPFEVLSFCFGQVYWREIDGNTQGVNAWQLSQRHGLYHLSAELLQLMSNREVLGEPHWALDRRLHGKYYASAAFAQFELGDLKNAQSLFAKRLAYVRQTANGSLGELTAELDLIAVKIELQQLDGLIEEIESIETKLGAKRTRGNESAAAQVRMHCALLKGQIYYSKGNFEAAIALLKDPHENLKNARLSIEASHYLVASLGAEAERLARTSVNTPEESKIVDKLREQALKIASSKLWHYASEGEQHVALGFRISSAHLFRNIGMHSFAETWMDSVYIDILRYGCSERTYLSFLREAGRIVRVTEHRRPARAYAVYLKPAAIRAASRGHVRAARVAFAEAIEALAEVDQAIAQFGAEWPEELVRQLQEPKEFAEEADSELHDFVPADPLFSFDLLGGEEWSTRLSSAEAVFSELKEFREEFEKLQILNA